jgi:hypothetical protein
VLGFSKTGEHREPMAHLVFEAVAACEYFIDDVMDGSSRNQFQETRSPVNRKPELQVPRRLPARHRGTRARPWLLREYPSVSRQLLLGRCFCRLDLGSCNQAGEIVGNKIEGFLTPIRASPFLPSLYR